MKGSGKIEYGPVFDNLKTERRGYERRDYVGKGSHMSEEEIILRRFVAKNEKLLEILMEDKKQRDKINDILNEINDEIE